MVKVLNIISSHMPQAPIAIVRTDNNRIDWVQDLYGIAQDIGDSYEALEKYIDTHNHLSIQESAQPLTFRQMNLKTGETVMISQDGKTILLNGKLLLANERFNLQAMLENGQLQVSGEAAPYIYKPKPQPAPPSDDKKTMDEYLKTITPPPITGNAHYDPEIENSDMSWVGKQLLCVAKHGTSIGGDK